MTAKRRDGPRLKQETLTVRLGSRPEPRFPSARRILADFVREND